MTYYLTPEDATLAASYDEYSRSGVLAELAAEEAAAWASLADVLTADYEPDLDDYEVQQALYLG